VVLGFVSVLGIAAKLVWRGAYVVAGLFLFTFLSSAVAAWGCTGVGEWRALVVTMLRTTTPGACGGETDG
jgi:hypothetical protein